MFRVRTVGVITGLVLAMTGCVHRPDVVLRRNTGFTKASTLALTVAGGAQDAAIFKPELEKELMRLGFNIVTDDVSQVVEQERRTAGGDTAAVMASEKTTTKGAATAKGDELTERQTSKIPKSEYSGRIDYLYSQGKHAVNRVNFTIFEVKTGSVVASIGYEEKGTNPQIAKAIAKYLNGAVTGVPIEEGMW